MIKAVTEIDDTELDACCVSVSVSVVGCYHVIKEMRVQYTQKGKNFHVYNRRWFVQT